MVTTQEIRDSLRLQSNREKTTETRIADLKRAIIVMSKISLLRDLQKTEPGKGLGRNLRSE
ncbi:MAG: hypothetical protein D8M57_10880 [Candidatus Scalindua sp. AMX11]|nr:MAG: hypothetical protein DWQ00_16175 [Candidatus Scalindua sp.]TDE64822.1 MAG: hypothetical protein D8M57_10880 [Candidatus Scalindua sp. AMX11]GJQ60854.1 MAG: hypothetical protein SCALA701_36550 [Candidatus Scalindua sp.]